MLDKSELERKSRVVQDRLLLTDGAVSSIRTGARALYEEIAPDIQPENKRRGTVKRDVIIEIVLDAGRLEEKFRFSNRPVANAIHNMSYQDLIDVVGPAFSHEEYEVGSY